MTVLGRRIILPNLSNATGREASQRNVHAVADDSDSDSSTQGVISTVAVATVSALAEEEDHPLYCKMLTDDKEVLHQIDPGAKVSCQLATLGTARLGVRKSASRCGTVLHSMSLEGVR